MSEQMQAGAELDALVAEKVFGLKVDERKASTRVVWNADGKWDWLQSYSTDWEGMRLVVEEMQRRGWTVEIFFVRGQCFATIDLIESGEVKEHADTAPHAVCLAALKALEADTHE